MKAHSLPIRAVLAAGVAMGLAGDYLLRAPGGAGLNFLLLFVGLGVSIWLVSRRGSIRISLEGTTWVGVGLLFALGLVWRGSPALGALSFLAAATAFSLSALHADGAWVRRSGVTDLMEAVGASTLHAAFGAVRLFGNDGWKRAASDPDSGPGWQSVRLVLRGILLAAPFLAVFGALFLSADEIFAGIMGDIVKVDLDALLSHLIGVTALSWLACGYLGGFLTGTRIGEVRAVALLRPSLGIVEVGTALALIDLLFLGFVAVQFRYLFGGSELVEVTPGLTYAQYARQGFFQIVTASTLVLPLLLAADWQLGSETRRGRQLFAALVGIQLLLLLATVASALERMRVYQANYGLTELRFFVTAFLVWLTVVVLWFAATVLRGRRGPFALGTLVSAFALVGTLQIVNPDALIARTNISRAEQDANAIPGARAGVPAAASIDVTYLNSLSSDAAAVLLQGLGGLPEAARCHIARRLLRVWGPDRRVDWRSWNWSVMRARAAVQAELSLLRLTARAGDDCE